VALNSVALHDGREERRLSGLLDPSALKVGDERNLVCPNPRGRRGFPLCDDCGYEACGPFAHHCYMHEK